MRLSTLLALPLLAVFGRGAVESWPLEPLTPAAAGAALFTELDADAIGLGAYRNDYSGPDVWTKRWREYFIGSIGVGIALGDIDGDGLPDLFVASKDEESRLYRNRGDLTFTDVSASSGFVDSPDPAAGCAFADVDSDGDLDLYLCFVGGRNQLWINDGSGRFIEEAAAWGVDVSSGCVMASFADFDRDGDLDFYLLNNLLHEGSQSGKLADLLFENQGGRFVDISEQAGIRGEANGHSATWMDFDEDGWPDIYVANDFGELDRLYRNNRDGTFSDVITEVSPQAPYYAMGADFGDIDNDGHAEIWVADMAATDRGAHMRTMGNNWHAYTFTRKSRTHQYLKNVLLLNLGSGRYADIAFQTGLARTDWTWAPRLVDLNNDGWLDAFASNGMLRSFHEADVIVRPVHTSADAMMSTAFYREPPLLERNIALENRGDLHFEDRAAAWGLDKLGISFGAAFGDLDRDGDLDLVLNNFQSTLSVVRNDEAQHHRIVVQLKGVTSNRAGLGARLTVTAGPLTQVKMLSPFRGYMSTDEAIVHFGLGDQPKVDRIEILWPGGALQVLEGLPADRRYLVTEAATPEAGPGIGAGPPLFVPSPVQLPEEAVRTEAPFDDFRQQPLLPFRESRLGGSVAVAELNGDGHPDLVLSGSTGQETLVLINRGAGGFAPHPSFDLEDDFGREDLALRLVDWNRDGSPDLMVAGGGVEWKEGDAFHADRLYLNDGEGGFEADPGVALLEPPVSTGPLALGDFDGDGDLDVFSGGRTVPGAYPHAAESSLWRRVDGGLVRVDPQIAPGLAATGRVSAADWADMDGDGDPDLILSREWATPVIWRNDGGVFLPVEPADGSGLRGLWSSQAIADLDGDGRLDIVIGNLGLNADYHASVDQPIRIWYSPRDDVPVRLIETFLKADGSEWTREERWRLEKGFPREMKRVTSYAGYAKMTFPEIFPGIEARGYRFLEINELRTGVLWQEADGGFTFAALPGFAQTGRAVAMVVEDVNRDGNPDLIVSLEAISPEPWTGRWETGQVGLFFNRGERRFETLLPRESGLSIEGSPRGLGWGDLDADGAPELILMQSEGMPRIFTLNP